MRSPAVIAPRPVAETVRRRLSEDGLLRPDLKVHRRATSIAFAVRGPPVPPIEGTEFSEEEFEPRTAPSRSWYGEGLALPEEARRALPRSFDVVGEIAIVRVPEALAEWRAVIGEGLLKFVPGVRLVADDAGVDGPYRVRQLRRLAGAGGFETVHRENGLPFRVDLEHAYFSPRLAREHARVASEARPGEAFWDLCSGIGPFGLTAARRSDVAPVTLLDANPAACALARVNAEALGLSGRVGVREQTLEAFLPNARLSGRVVFNLPLEGTKYLAQVAGAVEPGGTLHHYEVMERSGAAGRLTGLPDELAGGGAWSVVGARIVHPYSPHADLWAITLLRREA